MQDAYHLDVHIPKLPRIPVLWCATLLLEHVIVWRRRLHFSVLSQRDSGVWGGGRGFAPRSVFSKCLWSNQVPRRRRRRRRRTELIAGKVFLTFASNHSSLLISIIYFSLPLHILPLTNLFHQLFSFFFFLPSLLAFLSQRVSCLILSKTVQRLHLMPVSLGTLGKRNYRGIKENLSVLEWHSVV